jgi:hypothetical protein
MPEYSLMEHQSDGVDFLDSVDGIGALLWDPGVGKTGATLSWVDKLASQRGEVRVLVVAPLTAADTWVLQAPPFMDSVVKARLLQGSTLDILNKIALAGDWRTVPDTAVRADHKGKMLNSRVTILSVSAGAFSSYCKDRTKTVRVLRAIRKYSPHLIVLDESHIAKSATSNISKVMYQIGQLAPHRIILTGTVNPLSILDCYGQWRFLAPWTFSDQYGEAYTQTPLKMTRAQKMAVKPWPWNRFKDRYTTRGGYKGKGIGGFQNEDDLHDRVAERSNVVRKEDALDLPPVTDIDVHVTLSAREAKAYKQMAEDLVAQMDSGDLVEAVNGLAKLMKLRQIAAGFVKDTDSGQIHTIGDSLRKAICEVAVTQLAGEQRLVVFAYFRAECDLLTEMLKKAEPNTVVETITGQTKARDRLAIRQRFADVSGNPQRTILVAQARTMSLSVNELVTAQHAIYGSYSEQRADWVQSRGRLDRNGQKLPVTFWNVFAPGLIGEIMRDRHRDRGDLEKALLDHVREVAGSR